MKHFVLALVLVLMSALIAVAQSFTLESQGDLIDSEKSSVTANVSNDAKLKWEYALNHEIRTGPNSALWHTIIHLRAAATAGHPYAQYYLGMIYAHHYNSSLNLGGGPGPSARADPAGVWKPTDDEGIRLLELSARKGVTLAQFELYRSYMLGKGVIQNQTSAMSWLKRAADGGLAEAEFEYGSILVDDGDLDSGLKYVQFAANKHYEEAVLAMYALKTYRYTHNMTLEELKAAASSGDSAAMRVLGIELLPLDTIHNNLALNETALMPSGKFAADLDQAGSYQYKAAEAGDPVAEFIEGFNFRGVDRGTSLKWLQAAANTGYIAAQEALAESLENVDRTKAIYWYTQALAQGSSGAANRLGDMYRYGLGVRVDYVRAAKLYDSAMQQENYEREGIYIRLFTERHIVFAGGALIATGI
jgi:TPR repeat protein